MKKSTVIANFEKSMSMEGKTDDIYQNIQETEWISEQRKNSERTVEQIAGRIFEDKSMGKEEINNLLYELLMTSEKGGFRSGFCYAVNLLMECGKKEK